MQQPDAGILTTTELRHRGIGERGIAALVQNGHLVRIRRGWYAQPTCSPHVLAAVRIGGAAGCVTAAGLHGLWVLDEPGLHVSIPINLPRRPLTGQPRAEPSAVHWHDHPARGLVDVPTALAQMAGCQPVELTIAAADSALRAGLITMSGWRDIVACRAAGQRVELLWVDPRSDSLLESVMRVRLRRLGLLIESQVTIDGVGRVDFLVEERLVIELDGWAFHGDRDAFEEDRRRDAALASIGLPCLRFTYRQVSEAWMQVRRAILSSL